MPFRHSPEGRSGPADDEDFCRHLYILCPSIFDPFHAYENIFARRHAPGQRPNRASVSDLSPKHRFAHIARHCAPSPAPVVRAAWIAQLPERILEEKIKMTVMHHPSNLNPRIKVQIDLATAKTQFSAGIFDEDWAEMSLFRSLICQWPEKSACSQFDMASPADLGDGVRMLTRFAAPLRWWCDASGIGLAGRDAAAFFGG